MGNLQELKAVYISLYLYVLNIDHIVMVTMLASSVVDHGFKLQSCQTKDYKIGICCMFTMWRLAHRRLCRVKNMLAMYLKYHKAGLTPTTPVTSITISPVKMSIGHKSLTNLRSEMIFLQGKPVFYIFLPSTPPYWQIIVRSCWQWTPKWQQSKSRSRATYFCLSVILGFYHIYILNTRNLKFKLQDAKIWTSHIYFVRQW
jgi:hypothetical protein